MRTIFDPVSVSLLIGNIRITFLGLAQNLAYDAASTTPKSLVLRARVYFPVAYSSTLTEQICEFPETRKTCRAVFSEPKLVILGTSAVEPVEGCDSGEPMPSGERLLEAKPAAVAQAVSAAAGPLAAQLDGRQPKRARDIAEPVDCSTVGGARKKRKGRKKSG